MGLHNLLAKCDRALVAYIVSSGAAQVTPDDPASFVAGARYVMPAKRSADIPETPFVACFSDSATPSPKYSGNYLIKADVNVITNAAPDKGEDAEEMAEGSSDFVSDVFDAFHLETDQAGDTLADAITAAARSAGISDFTIQNADVVGIEQGRMEKAGQWMDTISLELLCYPSE